MGIMAKEKPIYKITIDPEYSKDGQDLGIEQIAFVKNPAIVVKGVAFKSDIKKQSFNDDLKYRIAAPALIPSQIYRNDDGDEYFVEFTKDEIENLFEKMMANRTSNLFNLEHNPQDGVNAYLLEAWLVGKDTKADRSWSEFGIDVPEGTLMVVSQFTDKEQYNQIVNNDQVGYSIEGYLGLALKLHKQEQMEKKLMLPDGKHEIMGKFYVVEAGEIVEVKEVELAEEVKDEEIVEEVKDEELAEEVKDEEIVEEVKDEEMAVDPELDTEAILAIVQPKLDEIYQMISDIKAGMEVKDEEVEIEDEVFESFSQKFSAVTNFLKTNK